MTELYVEQPDFTFGVRFLLMSFKYFEYGSAKFFNPDFLNPFPLSDDPKVVEF